MPTADKLKLTDLTKNRSHKIDLTLDGATLEAMAAETGADKLAKLRFTGELRPEGKSNWQLDGHLGVTATQTCVVSNEPVRTRIETDITRRYVANYAYATSDASEVEMTEDDRIDPLPEILDLKDILAEAIVLELPDYPRRDDAEVAQSVFSAPGVAPLTDEAAKPFAALAALKDQLNDAKD
ncbi:MAG: YceD family protein [Planktomarina sp.]